MGQCFENEQLGMVEEAIKCYRRAAENGDREGKSSELLHAVLKHCLLVSICICIIGPRKVNSSELPSKAAFLLYCSAERIRNINMRGYVCHLRDCSVLDCAKFCD